MAGANFIWSLLLGVHNLLGGGRDVRHETNKCRNNYVIVIMTKAMKERYWVMRFSYFRGISLKLGAREGFFEEAETHLN